MLTKYGVLGDIMSILNKLHNIINKDVAKLFSTAKKESVIASHEVEILKDQLREAQQHAADTARKAQEHAEAAAAEARKAAEELAIEARAAAEKAAFHTSQLEPKEPT
jgi:F0F1-type ATP synthase membrane subunit b/b'